VGIAGGDGAEEALYAKQVGQQSSEAVHALSELALERYARLVRARKDVHTRLPLASFVKVNRMVQEFARDVQHLSGQPGHTLTAEVSAQARVFMDTLQEEALAKLDAVLEMEQWAAVEVPHEYQDIIGALTCNQVPKITESDLIQLREQKAGSSPGAAKEMILAGSGYKVVGSSLVLLTVITHSFQCVSSMQGVASQVAHMLPAVLKLFHTKTFQQVLMAGAMRPQSANLKSIAAKHLALSSQALGMVSALLPHLKAILAAYVPEGQRRLLGEMDTVATDFEEHQQQVFAKLVSILEDLRREHTKNIAEALAPAEGKRQPEPSANIKAVVKNLASMHKQLVSLLTRQQLHEVFGQILATFDKGLLEAYRTVDVVPAYSRQCIVQDVHYLRKEVGKLHLTLPNGCCPDLVAFAQSLPLA